MRESEVERNVRVGAVSVNQICAAFCARARRLCRQKSIIGLCWNDNEKMRCGWTKRCNKNAPSKSVVLPGKSGPVLIWHDLAGDALLLTPSNRCPCSRTLNLYSAAQTRTGHQVSTPYPTALAPPSFHSRPGTSILMDGRSEGSLMVDNYARRWTSEDIRSRCQRMSFWQ
jgi:hypothetical protein